MDYNYFFSIIIPIYNKGAYLDRCLASILQQTYNNFEVIMIDDGSNDNSSKIANKFIKQDNRFSYYYHKNQGVSYSRNTGIKYSKGEYLLFIDADDSINSTYLFNIWQHITKCPSYPIYVFSLTKIFSNGHKERLSIPYKGSKEINILKKNFITEQGKNGIYGFVCNKAINKKFIIKNRIYFDTTQKVAEDLSFFIKCYSKLKNIYFFEEYGYNYYQNIIGSALQNKNIDYCSLTNIYIEIYKWLGNDINQPEKEKLIHKIKNLICSSFSEMQKIKMNKINQYILYYSTEPIIKSILKTNQNSDNLILYFLNKKYNVTLFYYLSIRKVYIYVKLRIIRSWRKC